MEKDNIKVSIILPTYNGSKYLDSSVKSCLNQTHRNLELIIIDDCSTDSKVPMLISSFKDSRIRSFRNSKNMGISHSLNLGFEKAAGEFFTWTSDDNFYEKNAIEKMLSCLSEKKEKFVYTGYYSFYGDDLAKKSAVKFPDADNLERNCITCFLFDREIFETIGGFDTEISFAQDTDYWLRISKHFKLIFLDELLYYYRLHSVSLSMSNYKAFSYRAEAILVQYKNTILDTEKAFDRLVDARAGYLKEHSRESFLSNFIIKNTVLYKSFLKREIEKFLLQMNLKQAGFSETKAKIVDFFDTIDERIADSREFEKMSLSAISDIPDTNASGKIVITLLKFLLDMEMNELFTGLRLVFDEFIRKDFVLFNNTKALETIQKLKSKKSGEEAMLQLKNQSYEVFLEPDIERDLCLRLSDLEKDNKPGYYYYTLKAMINNLILASQPGDIMNLVDFFDDTKTRKFFYDKALSLASDNTAIAEIQKKIQELYNAPVIKH